MKTALAFLYFSLVLLMISCQQEPDDVLPDPDPSGEGDSTYLKMVISLDTSKPSGADTSIKYVFTYDAQKRLEQVLIFEYYPGTPGVRFEHLEKRFYSGSDTLPYKMVTYFDDAPTSASIDTIYFTYHNGVLIKDSIISYQGTRLDDVSTTTFHQLANNRLYAIRKVESDGILVSRDSLTSTQTWQNGNLRSQQDTLFLPGGIHTWDFQREFDNNPNPLRRTTLPYPMVNDDYWIGWDLVLAGAKTNNNEIGSTWKADNTLYYEIAGLYQYRTDGYPVILRADDSGNGEYKMFFIYQKL